MSKEPRIKLKMLCTLSSSWLVCALFLVCNCLQSLSLFTHFLLCLPLTPLCLCYSAGILLSNLACIFVFLFFFFLFLFSSASMGFICPLLCPFVSFSLFCPFKLSLNYLFLSVTILRHFFTRNYYALLVYFRKQKYPWPLWSHSEFIIIVFLHSLQRKKKH